MQPFLVSAKRSEKVKGIPGRPQDLPCFAANDTDYIFPCNSNNRRR